jgi:hypothetical protein
MVIPFGIEFESSSSIAAWLQAARAGRLGFKVLHDIRKNSTEGTQCLQQFR